MQVHRPTLVREVGDVRVGRDLAPVSLALGPRFQLAGGRVRALGDDLQERASRAVELPDGARLLNATADLGLVVAATDEQLLLVTERVTAVPVRAADSATFVAGRLLVTAPDLEQQEYAGRLHTVRGDTTVHLLEPLTGELTPALRLAVADAGTSAVPHPSQPVVLLDAGEGQDGSRVWSVSVEGDEVRGSKILDDVVAASFSPSGDRLLLTPHPSFDPAVRVLGWPSLDELARLTPADISGPGRDVGGSDGFDLYGCHLDEDLVLVTLVEQDPVLVDGRLRPLARLDLSGTSLGPDAEVVSAVGLARRRFAVELLLDGRRTTAVWDV